MTIFVICVLVALTIILRVINDKQIRNFTFDAGYFIILVAVFLQKLKGIHLNIEVIEFAALLAILAAFGILVVRDFVKKS